MWRVECRPGYGAAGGECVQNWMQGKECRSGYRGCGGGEGVCRRRELGASCKAEEGELWVPSLDKCLLCGWCDSYFHSTCLFKVQFKR